MSVMTSFTRRSLAKNRMRTVVSIVGIALSVALITAIWTTVASLQQGLYQRTVATEGWWQLYAQGATEQVVDEFEQSDHATDIATSYDGGIAFFSEMERETLGAGVIVKSAPQTVKGQEERGNMTITRMPTIVEGRAPEAPGEVMLPERLRGAALGVDGGGASVESVVALEDEISLDVCRYVAPDSAEYAIVSSTDAVQQILAGGEVVDAEGNPVQGYGGMLASDEIPGEAGDYDGVAVQLAGRERLTYTVVGFYDGTGAHYFGSDFLAAGNGEAVAITAPGSAEAVGAASGEGTEGVASGVHLDVWASTQGFSTVDEIAAFANGTSEGYRGIPVDGMAVYTHNTLMRYQGISSDSLLQDSLTAMAGVLALVVAVASVSLIYNSFSISVAERTRQFGLLASLGASKRQLRRSVLVEALMLGAVGIPCGILLGIGGTAAVLKFTGAGFSAMLGVGEGLSLAVEPRAIVVSVVLSLATLLVSAWIPALRAGRVSAVDAIRQTQDVRLSRRARRKAERAATAPTAEPFAKRSDGGLWGMLAGVPGVIAHRNLSRQSARGRIVVASLAVSVVLVVAAGAVAQAMDPFASRAGSAAGASSDADVTLMASSSDSQNADLSAYGDQLDQLIADATTLDGVHVDGVVRQGTIEVALPAGMISEAGRDAIQRIHDLGSSDWVPEPFGEDGAYYGRVDAFYLDAESFSQMADALGVGGLDYADPARPRAIALNAYQGVTENAAYLQVQPFAQTGVLQAYCGATIPDGYSNMGVVEGFDGEPALGLLNQNSAEADSADIERIPIDEAARSVSVEVMALATDEPAIANLVSSSRCIPVLFFSDDLAKAAAASLPEGGNAVGAAYIEQATPFTYSFATVALQADDHAAATEQLQEMASDFSGLTVNVADLVVDVESSRLVVQTIQVFILCFTVIMALIAVANVFNTLTNSILLRTREFAVLKSVGMGDRAFARMLVCECASYALRGLVVGLVASVLVAWALYQALGIAFEGVGFTLPWAYIGAAVALVLVVLAISVAFALRKGHAANVVEALRSDAA